MHVKTYNNVNVCHNDIHIKLSSSTEELKEIYLFRYKIFVEELKWVSSHVKNIEHDEFDKHAIHLCMYVRGTLAGYLRILLPPSPWMFDTTFFSLLSSKVALLKCSHALEISRLSISPEYRGKTDGNGVRYHELLLHALYAFNGINNFHMNYFVISREVYRLLRNLGLPISLIGKSMIMKDGVVALAAKLDWYDLLHNLEQHANSKSDNYLNAINRHGMQLRL